MSRAILTIDDSPSKITPQIIEYLQLKQIVPVINFIGARVDKYFDEAVCAVKSGAVIGNHSFSHPHFSELSLEECRNEILQTEQEINRVYNFAKMERRHRVFRFPYGDKGGAQAELLQKMLLEEFQFERLNDSEVTFPFWRKYHIDTDIDMMWTFDFLEYELTWNNGFTWEHIINRIHEEKPKQGGYLLDQESMSIILMHDHEETNKCVEKYYKKLIDYVLSCNVEFVNPQYVKAT